jgi:hypothetical protein
MPRGVRLDRAGGEAHSRMRFVIVETNWLFEVACPAPYRTQDGLGLLRSANRGEVRLLLPAPSLVEARKVIRSRFANPKDANRIRQYLAHASASGSVDAGDNETVRRVLRSFEELLRVELDGLDDRIQAVREEGKVEVLPMTQPVLDRSVDLAMEAGLDLDPFDNAILSNVLVTAETLRELGETEVFFAEKDRHLQAVDRDGSRHEPICSLYDTAHVWVVHDFTLTRPERPAGW